MKQRAINFMGKIKKIYINEPTIQMAVVAFLVNLVVESFSRHSIIGGFEHLLNHPVFFGYNALIIFMMYCFGLLFKRRDSWVMLVSSFWLILGCINAIVLCFRITPLSLIDFSIAKSGITMLHLYLNTAQIILMTLSIVAVIIGVITAWLRMPKSTVKLRKGIIVVCIAVVISMLATNALTSFATKNGVFAVLTKAYNDVGFVYCFSRSIVDNGIDKPRNYSKLAIDSALKKLEPIQEDNELKPNLIILQLESFFDVSYMKNIECSENPIPNFTKLKETCSSGKLRVPSMGGGTANTEFEVLTGMNLDDFGIGEYPYQTVLKGTPCESLAYAFKEKGYRTTAIHNHTATFYGRNKVYPNLGFETFIPVEYMSDVERNELSWAKDKILDNEIFNVLESSEERDFIFAVSVQSHGKYPKEEIEFDKKITAQGFNVELEDELELKNEFEYYINQINEVDAFLGEFIRKLNEFPEPVVLVVYGDHLPALTITDDDLTNLSEYQTEYCIWTNYDSTKSNADIYAYQLSSVALNQLEMQGGLLPRVHQSFVNDDKYKYYLELFSYDILYGKNYSFNHKYEPIAMKYGLKDIEISETAVSGDSLYVSGDGFTEFSHVILNNKKMNTTYINENLLAISGDSLNGDFDFVRVSQINNELVKLSTTEDYIINNETQNDI